MQYLSALFGGLASNVLFWLLQLKVLDLTQQDAYIVSGVCFIVFGGLGYWLYSKSSAPATSTATAGLNVQTGLKGKNVTAHAEEITGAPGATTNVITDLEAQGDINTTAKNIKG